MSHRWLSPTIPLRLAGVSGPDQQTQTRDSLMMTSNQSHKNVPPRDTGTTAALKKKNDDYEKRNSNFESKRRTNCGFRHHGRHFPNSSSITNSARTPLVKGSKDRAIQQQSHRSCTGISAMLKESQARIRHDLHETGNRLVILRRDYYFIVLEIEIENVRLVMPELEACQVMRKLLLATRYLVNSHILDVSFGYLRVPDLVVVTDWDALQRY
ncbi:hypothetical protein BDV34DRAFT_219008 [Aspergillus parasiticus]|uniref:Uncharacterized protein n=1 Tax=Aspergillus parasiticus TaxID=5067 RepID=A0A5N6E4J9_ASPPA|nr:hypothetical protein BDV34DRAFT_219008 [Aspergillus parasiticus]